MGKTSIQWTDRTWSPIRYRVRKDAPEIARAKGYTSLVQISEKTAGHIGQHCEHVSPGCANCYSGTMQARCLPYNGTGLPFDRRSRDLVEPFIDENELLAPLKWRKPQRVFVENQSDLFGEWVPDEMIDRVFAVMALADKHTFQLLTKRSRRMGEYFRERWQGTSAMPELGIPAGPETGRDFVIEQLTLELAEQLGMLDPSKDEHFTPDGTSKVCDRFQWPLPNVWLGVSVEDEQRKDRIHELRATPAPVRFLSLEPLLEDLGSIDLTGIDWVIIGGESGRNARPMDIAWARSIVRQCKDSGVPCFVKQLGAEPREGNANGNCRDVNCTHPDCGYIRLKLKDSKGGAIEEWPADLRIREFPGEADRG